MAKKGSIKGKRKKRSKKHVIHGHKKKVQKKSIIRGHKKGSSLLEKYHQWRKHPNFKSLRFPLLLLCLVLIATLSITQLPTNCGKDEQCFQDKAFECKLAKLSTHISGNKYTFTIQGQTNNKCVVTAKLEKTNEQTQFAVKQALEGKAMVCEMPKELLQEKYITHIPDLMNYCTGPLKEALQTITIENMYEQVVRNLSTVIRDLRGGFVF